MSSLTKQIARSTTVVMAITLLCRGIGFVEKQFMAHYFGTGIEIDAYIVALSLPMMLFVCVQQLFKPTFLPIFLGTKEKCGELEAWNLSCIVLNLLLIVLSVVILLAVLLAPHLIGVLAPGFQDERFGLATRLTRIMLPAGLFLGLSSITYLLLNAYKRFALPALGEVVHKCFILAGLVLLYSTAGIAGVAIGVLAGSAGRLLIHVFALRRKAGLYRWRIDLQNPPFRRMTCLMLPIVIGFVFSQIGGLVDNIFASLLAPGSIAALSYAKKIVDLPILAVPYALGIVIFPYFSEYANREDKTELLALFVKAVRAMAMVFLPITILVLVLRFPIVQILFEHGKFDADSSHLTAYPLAFYGLGMLAFALEIVIMQLYFSVKDTLTPILVGIGCVFLHITLTILLIRFLSHGGIALALSCAKTVKILILLALLRWKFPTYRIWRGKLKFLAQAGVSSIATVVSSLWILSLLGPVLRDDSVLSLIAVCGVTSLAGIAVFLSSALLLGNDEARMAVGWMLRKMHLQQT